MGGEILVEAYFIQRIHELAQSSLDAIAALVPLPVVHDVIVHRLLIDEDVLVKLRGVVVHQIAQGVDGLCDGGGEEGFLLWEVFREGYKTIQSPYLRDSRHQLYLHGEHGP